MRTCETCFRDHKGLKCPIKKEITVDYCDYYCGHCQRPNKCFWNVTRFFKDKHFVTCLLKLDGGFDDCECYLPPWEEMTQERYCLQKQRIMGQEIGKEQREDSDYQEEVSRICQLKQHTV